MAHLRLTDNAVNPGHNRNPIYGLAKEPMTDLRAAIVHCQAHVPAFAGVDLLMSVEQAL